MIKFLLAFLLAVPAYAGVILKEASPQNKRWVYDDGLVEIILTNKQTDWCNGKYYLYVITGSQKIDGCWEEQDSLVHVKYDTVLHEGDRLMSANDKQIGGIHYLRAIQPWDFIAANGIGFFEGNVIKYVTRWRDKAGVDDLKKARHYLDKLIELEENK